MSYLILHKVRGEPAFDIADKLQIGDEEGWIIPTSGHRAYPFMEWPLEAFGQPFIGNIPTVPVDWPDHYQVDAGSTPKPNFNIMTIISPMMTKFKRRL
jgi:hypothetical protein